MFATTDQAFAVSSIADKILKVVGPKDIAFFHKWSTGRQLEVLVEAFPKFEQFPEEVQERIFCDVVHYTSIGSFSTH